MRRATTNTFTKIKASGRFQSTLSVRRATIVLSSSHLDTNEFQSTLSVRRATLIPSILCNSSPNFNPRSPWGERRKNNCCNKRGKNFNPRSPWGERLSHIYLLVPLTLFQSTLSVRRATTDQARIKNAISISIHALREESDNILYPRKKTLNYFNPRSPWGERPLPKSTSIHSDLFQSTLSVRRAT